VRHESGAESLPSGGRRDLITDRVVLLMVNESYRCLKEGRVAAADDLDLAMMLSDWAPHRGGPIGYAHQQGLDRIAADLKRLERFGPRFVWSDETRIRGE
jgi:3-hydroxyacyl-CoA dehydrogenase/enoyl-CoA hydratase/3-hydroxybutyryl-CoA epimerase